MVKSTQSAVGHHNWPAWVGTDEAGKGDYFGSLAVAGVYVNPEIREILHTLGVRDGNNFLIHGSENLPKKCGCAAVIISHG